MKKIVKLKESDLINIIKKVIKEQSVINKPTLTTNEKKGCPGGRQCGTVCCGPNETCWESINGCGVKGTLEKVPS